VASSRIGGLDEAEGGFYLLVGSQVMHVAPGGTIDPLPAQRVGSGDRPGMGHAALERSFGLQDELNVFGVGSRMLAEALECVDVDALANVGSGARGIHVDLPPSLEPRLAVSMNVVMNPRRGWKRA
jgi:hypothetical protein